MPKVVARIKAKGKQYEIHVDLDEALKVKQGKGDIISAIDSDFVYYDLNKGAKASQKDLIEAFGTSEIFEIAKQIIVKGEVQKTQEFRDEEKDARIKQIINLVLRNAVDQNGRPYTEERIKRALADAHYNFDNKPAEQQLPIVIDKLKSIIPIRIETKRVRLNIPARFTGQIYGLLKDYKENEEWLANGDLQVIINIPAGMLIDFYERINSVTHGAVQSQDLEKR